MTRLIIPLFMTLSILSAGADEPGAMEKSPIIAWIWESKPPRETARVYSRRVFRLPADVGSASVKVVCND